MAARRFSGIKFQGPPNVGGMDIGSILKLAGYGDEKGGYLDPSDQLKWILDQAKEAREASQFQTKEAREGGKSEADIAKINADIAAGQLKSQVDIGDLQRKLAEVQQSGRGSAITALTELINKAPGPLKAGDPDPAAVYKAALEKEIPELAEARGEERKTARLKKAGEITKQMIPIYQKGNKGVLAAQMATLEPDFQQDPELAKALPWQRYSELWPTTDATAATAAGQGPQAPAPTAAGESPAWNYLTGTQRIPQVEPSAPPAPKSQFEYAPGGPSAMPGQINMDVVRQALQQQQPLQRPGSVPTNYQYGTGVEAPSLPSGLSFQDLMQAAGPLLGSRTPVDVRDLYRYMNNPQAVQDPETYTPYQP